MKEISLIFELRKKNLTIKGERNFSFPVDYSSLKSAYIKINSKMSENDISGFISSLLYFNEELDLDENFYKALTMKEELALDGGLCFCDGIKYIPSSCCHDFQDWVKDIDSIKSGISPWLGHDPYPWIEFTDKEFIVWSDEQTSKDIFSIKFHINDLIDFERTIKDEIHKTLENINLWGKKYIQQDTDSFISGIENYLLAGMN